MKRIEWTDASLKDMAALDKAIARRIQHGVERFCETGAGNVKKLQGIDPPEVSIAGGRLAREVRFPRRNCPRSSRAQPSRGL